MNHDISTGKGQWIRTVNEYREKLGISWPEFRMMEKKELKLKIREYDTQLWMEEVLNKPSLQWYRIGKKKIGYEMCYRNTINSTYLAKARTNSLQLEVHLGRGIENYDKTCKLCNIEDEDLEHFLIRCPELHRKRDPEILRTETDMTSEQKTAHILFENKQFIKIARMIRNMWEYRKYRLRPP